MKTIFYHNHNNVLNDIKQYYPETTNLLKADIYLTWNDLIDPQKRVINLAREYGKTSIVVEHGMKAVSDYQKNLKDIYWNMGGKPMIADHFCCWGNVSKDILLEAGIPDKKVHVIGSPVVWEYDYHYKKLNAKRTENDQVVLKFNGGITITDPTDGAKWELQGCNSYIPQYEKGNIVAYFPGHNYDKYSVEQVRKVYEQIKHRQDLFVVLADSYINSEPDNPFRDLIDMKDDKARREKAIVLPTTNPKNMMFIKTLLRRTKCAVTTIPGTINGICWAMNVPTVVPEIDWHWRNEKDEIVHDIHDADYRCSQDRVNEEIDSVLNSDSKGEIRTKFAIDFMGIDRGSPTKNMRELIDSL